MRKKASALRRFFLGAKSIGFLTLHESEKTGYIASFLITDVNGIPMEFRCTHPLKPDAVQRSLYGERLLSYIGVEACGKPLMKAMKNKPKLLFVDKPFLLKLDEQAPYPTIFVKDAEGDEEAPTAESFGSDYHVEVIESEYNGFEPLEIVTKGELRPKTRELIGQVYAEYNLLEAFDRMKNAVESLGQLTSRFT